MATQVKPVVSMKTIESNSVTSVITRVSEALRNEGRVKDVQEMTERCMKANKYQAVLEIAKEYVVLIR